MTAPADAHAEAVRRVWRHLTDGRRTVVVDSPPGAGKSTLVRQLTLRLVERGEQVPVVTQTNDQADDLVAALGAALAGRGAVVGRLHGAETTPPDPAPPGVTHATRAADLAGCVVLVATAAKWAFVDEPHFGLGIVDEAYQMSSAALVRVADLFDRLLLVGDPGQLAPFTVADERVVRAVATWPLDTAAGTVLRTHPDTPVVPLPVSWRLPPSAAGLVSEAFYTRAFTAGTVAGQRELVLGSARVGDAHDEALHTAAEHGWALLELPPAYLPRTDPAAVAAIGTLVTRLLTAEAVVADETGVRRRLTAADLAVGLTHRDQRGHVRMAVDAACARLGVPAGSVAVDTANRLQGRQFEVLVAWHPLSGRRDAGAFHLEAGRLCVLASRHRHACVVVARGGLSEQLAACPPAEPVWLGAQTPQVDGWQANTIFLRGLSRRTVVAPDAG